MEEKLQGVFERNNFDRTCGHFKNIIYHSIANFVGYVECNQRDCSDKKDPEISKFMEARNQIHQKYLGASEKA